VVSTFVIVRASDIIMMSNSYLDRGDIDEGTASVQWKWNPDGAVASAGGGVGGLLCSESRTQPVVNTGSLYS
jgi:hypothetical protein